MATAASPEQSERPHATLVPLTVVGIREVVMGMFEDLHRSRITGSLAMFDRMIFKGYLSGLYKQDNVRCFLWAQGVALKDFTPYAKATTERIANNARRLATEAGRPVISFDHVKTRNRVQQKEELARSIVERDGVTEGIVCLISAVEACMSFQVRKSMKTGRIEATRRERKCLHRYLYLIDPEFGFMHVRIQGWIPYDIQVYVNGREWLARQLDRAGVGYVRHDNSLLAIDDIETAAELCERFPTGPGSGCSTPSPDVSTPCCRPSALPDMAATTGCSTRPRSPPTSCSRPGPPCSRSGPTWSATQR